MAKSRQREALEATWHVAVIALAVQPVARRVGVSRSLSALAAGVLVAGAAYHIVQGIRSHA